MDRTWMLMAVLLSAVITFSLRAFPFFAFRNGRKMPERLVYLGNILPSAIMAVLIVYCLKNVVTDFKTYGISELIAVFLTAATYKWKHNILLSIVAGTACNMVLLYLF